MDVGKAGGNHAFVGDFFMETGAAEQSDGLSPAPSTPAVYLLTGASDSSGTKVCGISSHNQLPRLAWGDSQTGVWMSPTEPLPAA